MQKECETIYDFFNFSIKNAENPSSYNKNGFFFCEKNKRHTY